MYEVEIKHDGLNKYKVIRGSDYDVVIQKAHYQERQWEEMWEKRLEAERRKRAREESIKEKEEKKAYALQLTEEANEGILELENILNQTLDINDAIDWDQLKDQSEYDEPKPVKFEKIKTPEKPNEKDSKYQPQLGMFDKIFKKQKEKKVIDAKNNYENDLKKWEEEKKKTIDENEKKEKVYKEKLEKWEDNYKKFKSKQEEKNKSVDNQKEKYEKGDSGAIIDYCDMVLGNSSYPDYFPQKYDLDYNSSTKLLVVDYSLPTPEDLPNIKEVKYIQSRDEMKETFLSAPTINRLYDDVIYQITLRSLHELFEADVLNFIEGIVFNGWVDTIDKALGKQVNSCILSIQVSKEEFMEINLSQVDPKLCFKSLKGIGSSKLANLAPIAPILKIDREDSRFVSSYDVTDSLNETDNLASMDWQDFEHLIRELFEKEFNQTGEKLRLQGRVAMEE